jgi:hypothetical protein
MTILPLLPSLPQSFLPTPNSEEPGFCWDPLEERWMSFYEDLKDFRTQNGHTNVPKDFKKNSKLSGWIITQRSFKNSDKLSLNRVELLKRIDFDWEYFEDKWRIIYNELVSFRNETGHCLVPTNHPLRPWVKTQRRFKASGNLSSERIRLLNQIGFTWLASKEKTWDDRYADLLEYKSIHGHSNIPVD